MAIPPRPPLRASVPPCLRASSPAPLTRRERRAAKGLASISRERWDNSRVVMNSAGCMAATQERDDRAHGVFDPRVALPDKKYLPAREVPPGLSRPRQYALSEIVVLRAGPRGAPLRVSRDSHVERVERWKHLVRATMALGVSEDRPIAELKPQSSKQRSHEGLSVPVGTPSPMAMSEHVAGLPRTMKLSALHASVRVRGGLTRVEHYLEREADALLARAGYGPDGFAKARIQNGGLNGR